MLRVIIIQLHLVQVTSSLIYHREIGQTDNVHHDKRLKWQNGDLLIFIRHRGRTKTVSFGYEVTSKPNAAE